MNLWYVFEPASIFMSFHMRWPYFKGSLQTSGVIRKNYFGELGKGAGKIDS
jgi:hypothetical protein